MQERMRVRRAAGDVNIHWQDFVDPAKAGVVLPEDAPTTPTRAHRHNHSGRRHRIISLSQSEFHIARHGTRDQ